MKDIPIPVVNYDLCEKLIKNGMILRYITTILTLYILAKLNKLNKTIHTYILLILPIWLTILDDVDNIFTKFYNYNGGCSHLYYYQYTDKICDSISYLLIYYFFKIDILLILFIIYRIIGVILFITTKNSKWLILFFDFVKEYLLYLFIFGKNYSFILMAIGGKICFEYYYHTIHNKNNYKELITMNIAPRIMT